MRFGIAMLAVASVVGCSFTTNFDRYDRESAATPTDGPDASNADADVGSDSGDGGPVASIHPNGTFETGCSGWFVFQSTLAPSSVARTGKGACLVCSAAAGDYFSADDHGALSSPPVGATYAVEAWVRAAPDKPLPSRFSLTFRTKNEMPFEVVEEADPPPLTPSQEWQRLAATLTITKRAQFLNVAVAAYKNGSPTCFLVDDVVLVRTK